MCCVTLTNVSFLINLNKQISQFIIIICNCAFYEMQFYLISQPQPVVPSFLRERVRAAETELKSSCTR